MTVGLALLLIATVAAAIAAPLLDSGADMEAAADLGVERLERDKVDYAWLCSFYERRALSALTEL